MQLVCFNSLAGTPKVAQQVTYRFARNRSHSKLRTGTFCLDFLASFGAFKMHCNAWSRNSFETPACTKFEGWISISESIHKTNQTGHTNFESSQLWGFCPGFCVWGFKVVALRKMGNIGKMGNMFDQTRPLHSPNNDQHVNMLFLKLPRLPSRLHRLKPRQFGRRQIHSPNRCKGPISTSFRHFQKGTELKELEGSAQTIPFGQAQEGTAVRGSAHSLACVEETMDRIARNLQPISTAIGSLVHTSHARISLSQISDHIFDTLPRVAWNQSTSFYST